MGYSYEGREWVQFSDLKGKVVTEVRSDDSQVVFFTNDGYKYYMYHDQDCCESVYIESIVGDLQDLVGEEILVAEEVTGDTPNDYKFEYEPESYTWTFYKLASRKGYVDIRWLGESNGYYSEGVSFVKQKA